MRIAILTSSLPPHPVGGAEHQASVTAARLAARGHRITVFSRRLPRDTPRVEERDGVLWIRSPVAPVPGISFLSHVGSFTIDWRRHDGPRNDVLLAYQMVINGVLGRMVSSPALPMVSWVRSQSEIRLSGSSKYRRFTPGVLEASSRILVQSGRIAAEMVEEYLKIRGAEKAEALRPKIHVLANAVDPGPSPDYEGRSDLVFVGRLVAVKGVDVLLAALPKLTGSPTLHIVGDGPERERLQTRAEGLPVRFHGQVPLEAVADLLRGRRLLVAPSRSEGFPNAILEAMRLGIPAVASSVGSIPDLLRDGENGFLVEPDDPDALANRIDAVLQDEPLWRSMAANARETSTAYGWDNHLANLEGILEQVCADRKSPG